MAFDRNNPADVLALKTEVDTDPALMGYTPADGDTGKLLDLLNLPANNVGNETGVAPLLGKDLMKMIFTDNISGPNQFNIELMYNLCAADGKDCDMSEFRAAVVALGDAGLNAQITAHIRPLSRAEVLFSNLDADGTHEFVTISNKDWFAARDL